MSETRVIEVPTPSRSYEVRVGRGVLGELGTLVRDVCPKAGCVALISDSTVMPLYGASVAKGLAEAGFEVSSLEFLAGEQSKRLSTVEQLLEGTAEAGLTRDDVVVAVGGGVTGDMAGLVAALYLRGIQVVQVPTSLLAMVDSSVGGKTAVDLAAGKNLCGVFLQPSLVVADINCLATVPTELLRDSCGELIKHGVIADESLFERLREQPVFDPSYDRDALVDIVARNVQIKRDVVVADERESGVRQTLNFGHTIGHAVEAASNFRLGHGSCVAIGMCCVARAAARMGWCDPSVAERIEDCVKRYQLPSDTHLDHDTIMSYLSHDKKRRGDGVNLVVPTAIGSVEVRRVSLDEMRTVVNCGCGV